MRVSSPLYSLQNLPHEKPCFNCICRQNQQKERCFNGVDIELQTAEHFELRDVELQTAEHFELRDAVPAGVLRLI